MASSLVRIMPALFSQRALGFGLRACSGAQGSLFRGVELVVQILHIQQCRHLCIFWGPQAEGSSVLAV